MDQAERRMKKLLKELKEEGCDYGENYICAEVGDIKTLSFRQYLNGVSSDRFGLYLKFMRPYGNIKNKFKHLNMDHYVLYDNGFNCSPNNFYHVIQLKDAKIKHKILHGLYERERYVLLHKSQLYKLFAIYKKLFIYMYDCFLHHKTLGDSSVPVSICIFENDLYTLYKTIRFLDRNDVVYKNIVKQVVEFLLYDGNIYHGYESLGDLSCLDCDSEEYKNIKKKIFDYHNKKMRRYSKI